MSPTSLAVNTPESSSGFIEVEANEVSTPVNITSNRITTDVPHANEEMQPIINNGNGVIEHLNNPVPDHVAISHEGASGDEVVYDDATTRIVIATAENYDNDDVCVLYVGTGEEPVALVVSLNSLRRASNIKISFPRAHPDGSYHMNLFCSDPRATFLIVCVLHHRFDLLPLDISLTTLLELAKACEKWDTTALMLPFVRNWLEPYEEHILNSIDLRWFRIATVFGLESVFCGYLAYLILNTEKLESGELVLSDSLGVLKDGLSLTDYIPIVLGQEIRGMNTERSFCVCDTDQITRLLDQLSFGAISQPFQNTPRVDKHRSLATTCRMQRRY